MNSRFRRIQPSWLMMALFGVSLFLWNPVPMVWGAEEAAGSTGDGAAVERLRENLNQQKGAGSGEKSKTPWLEGVDIPPHPPLPSPVFPAEITTIDGNAFPATISEDIPLMLSIQSEILGEKPPEEIAGKTFPKAVWAGNPSVRWFFDDVGKNKSSLASAEEALPVNQMKVTPLEPAEKGGVTVTIGRPMRFEIQPGRIITVFANASRGLNTKVVDITPPTCGLEVTVGGKTAGVWAAEQPLHQYPLPKMAAIYLKGVLFSGVPEGEQKLAVTMELGKNMRLSREHGFLVLPKKGEIKIHSLVQDNFQLDENSLRFGLGEWTGDQPVLLGELNPSLLNPEKIPLPPDPVLFVEAKDKAGNHSILAVPVTFQ